MKGNRKFLGVMAAVNAIVLLGQIWPEGAPPFARAVNIAFLVTSLVVFVMAARRRDRGVDGQGSAHE